ncbi:hypothetical protein [Lentzea aerocolonigenes]|nr:hypothetical protein [Lentzea aerocolonigenes]MCP2242628.1 hypothetical protein [Lentzea aerocolonigenes]
MTGQEGVVVVPKGRQGQVLRDARATVEAEHRARNAKALRDNGFVD